MCKTRYSRVRVPVRRKALKIVHIRDYPPENNDMAGCGVLASQDPHVIARGNDSDLKTLIRHWFFKTTSYYPPPFDRYKDWKLWSNTCFSRQRLTTHLPLLDIDTRITGLHPSRGSTNHRKRIGFQKLVPTNSCWRDCTIFKLVDIFGQKKRILGKERKSLADMKPNLYNIYFLYRWFCVKWIPYLSKSCDTGRVPSTSKPSIISTIV